jgi:protein involved in polysaccharide export with SLBB domain
MARAGLPPYVRHPMKTFRVLLAAILLITAVRSSAAQIPGTQRTQVLVGRIQLDSLLASLEQAAQSNVYSSTVREQFRREAGLVRARLADGDFRPGDRILLDVEGESTLTDTFTVQAGRQVQLPAIGFIPLQGVLRAELTDFLTTRLRQFLREPKVRARALIKLTISGQVTKQCFCTVPADIPIDGVLELAGGPTSQADLQKIKISRRGETIYDGERLQQLITEGTTIDALDIQAGDVFFVDQVPQKNPNPAARFQAIQYLIALPVSIFALGKLLGF